MRPSVGGLSTWTLSPQMTAAPELWRGARLAFCSPFSRYEIIKHSRLEPNAETEEVDFSFESTEVGSNVFLMSPSLDNEGMEVSGNYTGGMTECTIAVYVKYVPSEAGDFTAEGTILSSGDTPTGTDSDTSSLQMRYDESGFLTGGSDMVKITFGGDNHEVHDGLFTANEWHTIATTVDSEGGIVSWFNGNRDSQSISAPSALPAETEFQIACGGATSWTGYIAVAILASRVWSEGDALKFTRDPFCMFRPAGF